MRPWPKAAREFKLRLADVVLITGVLTCCGGLAFYLLSLQNGPHTVYIKTAQQEYYYSLDQEQELHLTGPLGETVVCIAGGKVWIRESACPEKLCVKSGPISQSGSWVACLPNQVFVSIEGKKKPPYDAESY